MSIWQAFLVIAVMVAVIRWYAWCQTCYWHSAECLTEFEEQLKLQAQSRFPAAQSRDEPLLATRLFGNAAPVIRFRNGITNDYSAQDPQASTWHRILSILSRN